MKWLFILLLLPFTGFSQNESCDILITNGKIIDGTGNSWYYGNIAIKNGKIMKIGQRCKYDCATKQLMPKA